VIKPREARKLLLGPGPPFNNLWEEGDPSAQRVPLSFLRETERLSAQGGWKALRVYICLPAMVVGTLLVYICLTTMVGR